MCLILQVDQGWHMALGCTMWDHTVTGAGVCISDDLTRGSAHELIITVVLFFMKMRCMFGNIWWYWSTIFHLELSALNFICSYLTHLQTTSACNWTQWGLLRKLSMCLYFWLSHFCFWLFSLIMRSTAILHISPDHTRPTKLWKIY